MPIDFSGILATTRTNLQSQLDSVKSNIQSVKSNIMGARTNGVLSNVNILGGQSARGGGLLGMDVFASGSQGIMSEIRDKGFVSFAQSKLPFGDGGFFGGQSSGGGGTNGATPTGATPTEETIPTSPRGFVIK